MFSFFKKIKNARGLSALEYVIITAGASLTLITAFPQVRTSVLSSMQSLYTDATQTEDYSAIRPTAPADTGGTGGTGGTGSTGGTGGSTGGGGGGGTEDPSTPDTTTGTGSDLGTTVPDSQTDTPAPTSTNTPITKASSGHPTQIIYTYSGDILSEKIIGPYNASVEIIYSPTKGHKIILISRYGRTQTINISPTYTMKQYCGGMRDFYMGRKYYNSIYYLNIWGGYYNASIYLTLDKTTKKMVVYVYWPYRPYIKTSLNATMTATASVKEKNYTSWTFNYP